MTIHTTNRDSETIHTTNKNSSAGGQAFAANSSKTALAAIALGGTALAAMGLTRRSWARLLLATGGGYLVYRGVSDKLKPQHGKVRVGFTINRSPAEVYEYAQDSTNWTRFLKHMDMVRNDDGTLKLTFGKSADINAESLIEISDQKPGEFIAWRTLPGPIQHRGVIRFRKAPGNRGTEVSVALQYKIPAGPLARGLALLVGWDPEQLVRENLRHLKQLLEGGEIPTTAGQPHGSRGMKGSALRVLYRESPVEKQASGIRLAGD